MLTNRKLGNSHFDINYYMITLHANPPPPHSFQRQDVILTVCNPAHRTTVVSLRQLNEEEEFALLADLLHSRDVGGEEDGHRSRSIPADSGAGGDSSARQRFSTVKVSCLVGWWGGLVVILIKPKIVLR